MADRPQEPQTKQLPAADRNEVMLAELKVMVTSGFRDLGANLNLVANDLSVVKDRLSVVERWKGDTETRLDKTSLTVKRGSEVDLEQASQLMQEKVAREALAREVNDLKTTNNVQLAILARLDGISKNPVLKTLGLMLATAAISWLATHGVHVPQ